MAEPKPLPACATCDHICEENPEFNPDQECWGRMTAAERVAYGKYLVATHAQDTLPPAQTVTVWQQPK